VFLNKKIKKIMGLINFRENPSEGQKQSLFDLYLNLKEYLFFFIKNEAFQKVLEFNSLNQHTNLLCIRGKMNFLRMIALLILFLTA
jgi:hypothetical protein